MAVIRNLVVKISADISSLSKGLQNASKNLQKVSQNFTKIGTSLTTSVTLPIVAMGTAIVKTSADFEQSMANAASVAGATGEELERMTVLAREMGSKTVFSASDAADALYYMASAGYKVDQMASSIEATLNLASATQSDLAFTTDTVISALNQYGLEASEAERVTNVYASAIGNSMANMEKLSNSMGYVGPVANSLGYSIEEVTGTLSVLYNAGYDGSTAGTTLRQALVSLMNPTASALAIFEELGIAFDDVNPASNDFASILDTLSASGMDTAQAMEVFGARGGPGMLALMNQGGDAVRNMTKSITGTSKATEMAATQLDTLTGQTKILKSELEEIAISFGDVLIPIIRQFISKYISPLTKKLMALSTAQKEQIVKIAAIAAAIGPLFLVIGKLTGGLATIIKIVPLLFSKVGLIIGIISLVVGALTTLFKTNENFRNKVLGIWDKIKSGILKVVESLKAWWDENGNAIKGSICNVLNIVANAVLNAFTAIFSIAKKVWPYVKEIVSDAIKTIKSFWDKYGEKVKALMIAAFTKIKEYAEVTFGRLLSIVQKVWSKVKQIITDTIGGIKKVLDKDGAGILNILKGIFNFVYTIVTNIQTVTYNAFCKLIESIGPVWEKLKTMFVTLWDTVKELYETLKPIIDAIGAVVLVLFSIISGVINGVISMIGPLVESVISSVNVILEIIRALCALLRGDFSGAWEHIKQAGISFWESIKSACESFLAFFTGFADGFMTFFGSVGEKIAELFRSCWDGITGFFNNALNGINSALNSIWTAITNLFNKIKDFFANMISDAFNWGKNLIDNIGQGIENTWNSVVDGVESVGQSIADFLGFGSPTKKGPGHTADEWIPNLMNMMADGMYSQMPVIQNAALEVASALSVSTNPNKAVVGQGTSPFGDMLNGLLQTSGIEQSQNQSSGDIILEIDGQTFARLIMPKLTKEYKRNGIILREV